MARILLLDGHCSAALAFVRSLGRAGHWVAVGASSSSQNVAGLSRYCRIRWSYPSPLVDMRQTYDAVAAFVRDHRVDLVVPLTDATVWPLAILQEQLGARFRLAAANLDALAIAVDKYQTVIRAKSCRIPTPETALIRSQEDLNATAHWQLPLAVKDRFSIRWLHEQGIPGHVVFADSSQVLRARVEQRLQEVGDVLVQEFCSGRGIGLACLAIEGEVRLPFQWERVREKDPRGSGSSARRSLPAEPRLIGYVADLLGAINYTGLAMVEFKKHAQDFVLMEINPRPWGSLQLPLHCGIDYPNYVVRWYLDHHQPERSRAYQVGITSRSLVDDLVHLENVWQGRPDGWPLPYPRFLPTLMRIMIPWYPRLRYDDLWLRDPRPGLAQFARWFQCHLGRTRLR